ncbi:MAG: helix-turn-helix transcriptional regulator [Clostridia bacterium]|nr:helix-turn-helix transcriptional regulator [Clostridia bacterium]
MYYYQRIRDLREDNGKTQTDIAKLLGTTRQQYARWESGAQELPMHHFITLAKFYNISLDYITGLTNKARLLKSKDNKTTYKRF